jgi:hypothetical protein
MRQTLIGAGLVAGALYALIVLVGGLITPGYDHVAQPVSSLYQAGAANGLPIAVAFLIYNLFVVAFGMGMSRIARASLEQRRKAGVAAGVAIVLVGLAGAADAVFPQDPIGSAMTTAGTLHIVFAGVASLLTVCAVALAAAWLFRRRAMRPLAWYSIATLGLVIGFGPMTAVATASNSPLMGLLERVTIFAFIVWMTVTAFVLSGAVGRAGLPATGGEPLGRHERVSAPCIVRRRWSLPAMNHSRGEPTRSGEHQETPPTRCARR